jgi:iron complex transport system substrate-binding protein
LLWAGCGESSNGEERPGEARPEPQRVISLGASITETVYALGGEQALIAADLSSTYPDATRGLQKVGYQRTISAENILALRPDMIVASSDAGPPVALDQIRRAGVPIVTIPSEHSLEGVEQKIRAVAAALDRAAAGERLCASIARDAEQVERIRSNGIDTPSVLFIYARGSGTPQVSGKGTAADAMIGLAGGTNVVTEYDGYKPLTPEAIVSLQPDVVLMTTSGLQAVGGPDGLLKLSPALRMTPAGRERRIVSMDDERLLGFGPRCAEAVLELAGMLHRANAEGETK